MDRPLGALNRAVVLAVGLPVLAVPWAGATAHGDDDTGPPLAGTTISGTVDPARAPDLGTGRYLDRLPADDEVHYRLPRSEPGSTFHVAAMFVGAGDSIGEGVRLKVGTTPGDQGCGSSGVFRPTQGEPAPVLFTTVSTWTDVDDHECARADTLHLAVGVPSDAADAGRDVEILVYEEPPLSAYAFELLPEPDQPAWVALKPSADGRDLPLGTTPTNAPVVRDGSFDVELRPGRTAVLAVPLDWDQSLQAQLDAVLPKDAPATDRISVDIIGPLLGTSEVSFTGRQPSDWSRGQRTGRFRIGAQSHQVAYPNRDSYDAGINTESLAGMHYVLISWTGTDEAGPEALALRVPATVTLATTGEPQDGVPAYTEINGLIGPQPGSRLVDGTLQPTAAAEPVAPEVGDSDGPTQQWWLVGGGLGVVAALLLLLARLRRHHHAHRGRHRG